MWRALGITLAGLVLLGMFAVGAILLEHSGAEFEASGTRAPGVVVETHIGIRNSLTADVRYRAAGVELEGLIQLDSSYSAIKPGDSITVIYDPADPGTIVAPGIHNAPAWATFAMTLLAISGLSTFIVDVIHLIRAAGKPRR